MQAAEHAASPMPLWMRIAPYRACDLCDYAQPGPERLCSHPASRTQPVRIARAKVAACGPDAHLFTNPELQA